MATTSEAYQSLRSGLLSHTSFLYGLPPPDIAQGSIGGGGYDLENRQTPENTNAATRTPPSQGGGAMHCLSRPQGMLFNQTALHHKGIISHTSIEIWRNAEQL